MAQIYSSGGLIGGTNETMLGGSIQAYNQYQALSQAYGQFAHNVYINTETTAAPGATIHFPRLTNPTEPVKESKPGKILLDLRREIDDWHGDILRAA